MRRIAWRRSGRNNRGPHQGADQVKSDTRPGPVGSSYLTLSRRALAMELGYPRRPKSPIGAGKRACHVQVAEPKRYIETLLDPHSRRQTREVQPVRMLRGDANSTASAPWQTQRNTD
jgi:hypothetical protein